jgi:hypothetical protein
MILQMGKHSLILKHVLRRREALARASSRERESGWRAGFPVDWDASGPAFHICPLVLRGPWAPPELLGSRGRAGPVC